MDVHTCSKAWRDCNSCRLSESAQGWGCRHLLIMPDKIPVSELERAKLFSKVYSEAENLGILSCPHFNSLTIDDDVADDVKIASIMSFFRFKLSENCRSFTSDDTI